MIYLDNAATTKNKPQEVYSAINYYLQEIGVSPGRGSYSLGIEASRMLYKSRVTLGNYFGMTEPDRVLFTKNSTEAINLFFNGFLKKGDHVIISCYEHNAVLRPLQTLKDSKIIDYSVIKRDDLLSSPEEIYQKYAKPNTKLLAITLASNLTGRIIFNEELFSFFKQKGITTFLDASQGAGKISLNMREDSIDYLAFTGHKDLLGIPGVGGLCCEAKEKISPLIQGGTGIHGEEYTNPDIFPEGYEAGTLNMPAIWALKTGVEYLLNSGAELVKQEHQLMELLVEGLKLIPGITVFDFGYKRVPTCCFIKQDQSSDKTIQMLDREGICARGGIHCAILAHEAIGTVNTGAVRISIGFGNTENDIKEVLRILSR